MTRYTTGLALWTTGVATMVGSGLILVGASPFIGVAAAAGFGGWLVARAKTGQS
jgi:hypothetical protein